MHNHNLDINIKYLEVYFNDENFIPNATEANRASKTNLRSSQSFIKASNRFESNGSRCVIMSSSS